MMSFNKRRIFIASDTSDDDDSFKRRRSSLRVNLSCEHLTDSGNGSLCKPEIADERETDIVRGSKRRLSRSKRNDTHEKSNQLPDSDNEGDLQIKNDTSKLVNQDTNIPLHIKKGLKLKRLTVDLENISIKERTLETNCKRLKDAILNKTKEIFDKELAKKTEMILKNEENLHDTNIGNKSGIILDPNHQLRNKTILEHEKCTNIVNDQQRDNQYANIVTTPISSKLERPKKAIDKSKLTQRRLFAKEDRQIEGQEKCRIVEDIALKKKISILPFTQTDQSGSPILSGSNRRLSLVRTRFKLHSQTQFENLNTSFSTIHSENVGAPIICSTFNEDIVTDENEKNSLHSETNSDMDTSRATHTTNKVISMEITEIHGGIRMSEKRLSLQRTNLSTNNSIENGKESKQESLEQTRCAIQMQRTENINSLVNKSMIQNNVSNCDLSNTSASNDQNTVLPMQTSSIEQVTVTKTQPQVHEHSNKTNNERRRTVTLSDSDGTIRSSLNVNTSLDAITETSKEENVRKINDYRINNGNQNFKTIKTNDEESVTLENQYEKSNMTEVSMKMNTSLNSMRERWQRRSTHQSLMSNKNEDTTENHPNIDDQSSLAAENIEINNVDSLENISLIQRLRNISTQNQVPCNNKLKVSKMKEKVTTNNRSDDTENEEANDGDFLENISLIQRLRNISTRMDNKSNAKLQSSENTNGDSYVEPTPYPISRSVLFRTQLKHKTQNLDSSTSDSSNLISINNKKNNDETDNESNALCPETADTIVLENTSNDNSSVIQDQLRVIEETVNESKLETSEKSTVTTNNTECISVRRGRRKLLPLDDHSQLCSFTPIEEDMIKESPPKKAKKEIKKTKKNIKPKKKHSRRTSICLKNDTNSVKRNITHEQTLDNDYDIFKNKKKKEKKIQKPRKVVSKKIVIKKFAEENMLNILKENKQDKTDELLENRHSLNDFVKHRTIPTQWNKHKSQKIVIAMTGLSKGDKSLVKSIVKSLGKAEIELNVSRRTTHVVSTGVRTANLLRGIIRGCWLVTLDWVLKSLENNGWLDPEEFEMKHFSKAVQENRKDRQLFGVSYIPELFATCGLIYVGQTTLPCQTLKELIKTAGGHITDDIKLAKIIIDTTGLKETWIIDSITTGELQLTKLYQRKQNEQTIKI